MKHLLQAAIIAAFALANIPGAGAAEVTLIAPGGIRAAVEQMIPAFEKKTGHKVKPTFGSGNGTKAQVTKGDAFDVPIVQPPYPEVLASGNVVAASETPLAHVAVGVAVRPGTPHPDISTPEAVKKMLLSAKSISYPDPAGGAAAGVSFNETLKKLGITDELPHRRANPRARHYTEYYTRRTREVIANKFKVDIERFGYEFAG